GAEKRIVNRTCAGETSKPPLHGEASTSDLSKLSRSGHRTDRPATNTATRSSAARTDDHSVPVQRRSYASRAWSGSRRLAPDRIPRSKLIGRIMAVLRTQ